MNFAENDFLLDDLEIQPRLDFDFVALPGKTHIDSSIKALAANNSMRAKNIFMNGRVEAIGIIRRGLEICVNQLSLMTPRT